ncbi:hypothetical protein [Protaetiibacter larvae]|uniref:Uncharacterized protein n=1 Tax=Protaetiibacter larvae TaxID=2592654 RepID=A0A5C1Y6N4_9MICO|nr:hypothetical protein [Protaetiibacter larvae]QEO09461.1 hypothetical protein FLP23_05215 [Protaetiibacter larvae]
MTTTPHPADDTLDPEAALALIDDETRGMQRATVSQVPFYYFVWGVAWLVGYLLLWASWDDSGSPVVVPSAIAVPVFTALIVLAAVGSAVVGIRANRGIRGGRSFVGTVYGISWSILGFTAASIGVALARSAEGSDVAILYFPSAYALVVAALYLAGAMLWHSIDQLVIAIVMALAAAATPWFGAPGNLLAMALIAGGALTVGGVLAVIRVRRL